MCTSVWLTIYLCIHSICSCTVILHFCMFDKWHYSSLSCPFSSFFFTSFTLSFGKNKHSESSSKTGEDSQWNWQWPMRFPPLNQQSNERFTKEYPFHLSTVWQETHPLPQLQQIRQSFPTQWTVTTDDCQFLAGWLAGWLARMATVALYCGCQQVNIYSTTGNGDYDYYLERHGGHDFCSQVEGHCTGDQCIFTFLELFDFLGRVILTKFPKNDIYRSFHFTLLNVVVCGFVEVGFWLV